MQTSKKIIIAVPALAIILWVGGLFCLRNDLEWLMDQEAEIRYEPVAVAKFKSLNFSGNWSVKIKQGKEYKVEIEIDEDALLKPKLKDIDGTLFFLSEGTNSDENTRKRHVKIAAPSLEEIKALHNTDFHLENFHKDSISVIMENGGTFSGKNNNLNYITLKTSGDALIQISDNTEH